MAGTGRSPGASPKHPFAWVGASQLVAPWERTPGSKLSLFRCNPLMGSESSSPSLALLPQHPLFQVRIGRLGPEPHREQHGAEGRTGNGQLLLAVDGEGRARARNVSEDHFVARLDGLKRVEQPVDV